MVGWQEEGSSGGDGGRTCVMTGEGKRGMDAAVHHRRRRRRRREVFVQNGEGWLNCYRSSNHVNIVYLAAPISRAFRIPLPPPPALRMFLPRVPARPTLSTHYANMRYQFDGDPRLFVSSILIARPVDRLIPRVRVSSSVPKFGVGIGSSVFNARFLQQKFRASSTRCTS